jgi:hypothetical protein
LATIGYSFSKPGLPKKVKTLYALIASPKKKNKPSVKFGIREIGRRNIEVQREGRRNKGRIREG